MYEQTLAESMKQLDDKHSLFLSVRGKSETLEKTIEDLTMQLEDKNTKIESCEKQLDLMEKKVSELLSQLEDERDRSESAEDQIHGMKKLLSDYQKNAQVNHSKYSYRVSYINAFNQTSFPIIYFISDLVYMMLFGILLFWLFHNLNINIVALSYDLLVISPY